MHYVSGDREVSTAVKKVREHIALAGARVSPEDLPFEIIFEDREYDVTKWGHLVQYVLQVPVIESTQTPRMEYVEIIAEVTRDNGIEDSDEWVIEEVERKTKTVTTWEKK